MQCSSLVSTIMGSPKPESKDSLPLYRTVPMKVSLLLNSESGETVETMPISPDSLKVENEHLISPSIAKESTPASVKSDDYESVSDELKKLTYTNLLRSHVQKRLPDVDWDEIVRYVETLTLPTDFTKPEIELIVLEWYKEGPVNHRMLEYECFARTRREIHLKICALEDLYGLKREELECLQIIAMEVCNELQLFLLSDIKPMLPHMSTSNIAGMISKHYKYKNRWLDREVEFISDCIEREELRELILEALVFRKPYEIRNKIDSVKRRLRRQSTPPIKKEPSPVVIAYESKLSELMNSDLTLTGIRLVMGSRNLNRVVQDIQSRKKRDIALPFTYPETEFLRHSLTNNMPMADIMKELVIRSEEEVVAKLKTLQMACVRQKKFTNTVERLIYEAQWYMAIADGESGGRPKRRTRNNVELDDLRKEALTKKKKVERTLTPEEISEKQKRSEIRTQRRIELLRRKAEENELRKKKASMRGRKLRSTRKQEAESRVAALIEEARWFQSVTGDGTCVKEGEKRKRRPVFHLVPEFKNRQQLKNAQKRLVEKKKEVKKKRGRGRPRRTPSSDVDDSTSDSDSEDDLEKLQHAIDSDESDEFACVSSFDPTDIIHDSLVPLSGRQLFNNAITSGSVNPQPVSFSDDVLVMIQSNQYLPVNDTVAAKVIKDHIKSYKPLGASFPPLFTSDVNGLDVINSRNIIHIRYLLYPQHTEQFVLAAPKSNELDPVFELQKIFQIHYALFFSHSSLIKDIIYENYCKLLERAVEEDNFSDFMTIIDQWNTLMLALSPYPVKFDPSIDINEAIRLYLPSNYKFQPTVLDLKLDIFYYDVLSAGEIKDSDKETSIDRATSPLMRPTGPIKDADSAIANIITRFRNLRPLSYPNAFIRLLQRVSEISRFAIQQILLRAYTRIVSPNSRKLRSYKAFTAEVYGELLPSFVSEVLTKVDLKPEHSFYDLGSGVGNTTFQAALEFGVKESGGCELMNHASELTSLQEIFMQKQLIVFGLKPLPLHFALNQSFVNNPEVRLKCVGCDVLIVNNYLFDFPLNVEVGKLLYGMRPGSKIISLKNFIPPRYKAGTEKTIFDYLKVEKHEMSDYLSVSWTANKVPYYISTVQESVQQEYV